jgi:hypothetical protein
MNTHECCCCALIHSHFSGQDGITRRFTTDSRCLGTKGYSDSGLFMNALSIEREPHVPPDQAHGEHRDLVRRIVASSTFRKSPRLCSFLTYICELTFEGRAEEINEQQIGAAVFGRTPRYDSSIDGIVRAQASRLRNRLGLYFEEEGMAEPTRIVIPRGGYVPHFIPQAENHFQPDSGDTSPISTERDPPYEVDGTDSVPIHPSKRLPRWFLSASSVLVLVSLLSVPILLLLVRRSGSRTGGAVFNPLWQQLFLKDRSTLVIYADSALVLYQIAAGRNLGLAEYLKGDYRDKGSSKMGTASLTTSELSTRRYTSVVDLEIVRALDRMAEKQNGRIDAQYARDVRPNDLKDGNSILIGAAEATPWVELFERNMHFSYTCDRVRLTCSVINKSPIGTEPQRWDSAITDQEHKVYAVVAYLPSLSGTGNTLILEGTGMAGTEAAWDFVSDDSQFLPFLEKLRRPDHSLPHFEVVLGTTNMRGNAARISVLTWRTVN